MTRILHAIRLAPAALAAASVLAAALVSAPVEAPEEPGSAPAEPGRAELITPILGFGINAHHISDLPLYLESVDAIAAIGANTLLLVTPMFQQHVDSNEIRYLPDKCPTTGQLTAILQRARRRGLQTVLLPIVLIEDPGEKDWRGVLRPTDREAWWRSYEQLIDRFVDLAVAAEVDVFSIGSELNTFEGEIDRWRAIVDRVRGRFDGRLTYTANWDRFQVVSLWPLVDFMSVSSYFELSREDPDASAEQLARAWRTERSRLLRWSRRHDRAFVLMELGYPSVPWAAAHPWDYVPRDGTVADHEAQARCWQAFFLAWTDVFTRPGTQALGFNCYYWDPYHHGEDFDTGYGVQGKPAREIIQNAFARIRQRAIGH